MDLYDAAQRGNVTDVKQALEHAKDVNVLGPERKTPLIEAAQAGHLDVVHVLLEAGAESEWRDASEETALLKAAANGHADIVSMLLPRASRDDQDMAKSFLAAHGKSHDPAFHYDPSRLDLIIEKVTGKTPSALQQKAAEVAARAANFVGHEDPLKRLERQREAEQHKKKR